jgi:hypothetical protein
MELRPLRKLALKKATWPPPRAPSSCSPATASARRTTLTVCTPRARASRISRRATAEVAAFCTSHSTGASLVSSSMSHAVAGLTPSIAAWTTSSSRGTAISDVAGATSSSLHVPVHRRDADRTCPGDPWGNGCECAPRTIFEITPMEDGWRVGTPS